ncbi:helix-turn-helix domain-containing protein [Kribbella deserti]|uniref:Multiprotein-bridging factor 1 family protein n=1 Tax=Kribbella deserti TaxID=1926257 RepID=A0ABV6QS36_9ACTN
MNETLRRALVEARFTERDLAARLGVNPRTVRRWLEGRLPYPRRRGEVASLLGLDEGTIWPEVEGSTASTSKPAGVVAIYPYRSGVPEDAWASFLGRAQYEVNILAYSAGFLVQQQEVLDVLRERSVSGVRVMIALADGERTDRDGIAAAEGKDAPVAANIGASVERLKPMVRDGHAELRLHSTVLPHSLYRADDHVLVNQHVYGFPAARSPVYHVQKAGNGELFDTYMSGFRRIWDGAVPFSE